MKGNQYLFSDFNIGLVTGLGVGLAISLYYGLKRSGFSGSSSRGLLDNLKRMIVESKNDLKEVISEEYKMVMVVNTKLKMEKGKVASQCCHAAVGVFIKSLLKEPKKIDYWQSQGSKKIVLKAADSAQLEKLQILATEKGLSTTLIRDAGLTQIDPGSKTILGIGPDAASLINQVVGDLKLY